MSRPVPRRHPRFAAVAAALALSLLPIASAAAADAPIRLVDLDAAGARTGGSVVGIAAGAREVLLSQPTTTNIYGPRQTVVRDLVAQTTQLLLPSSASVWAVSDDTTKLLVSTTTGYDAAADTNGALDLYVYDRTARTARLATRTPGGTAAGSGGTPQGALSRDGRTVVWSTDTVAGTFRTDTISGTTTKVTGGSLQSYDTVVDRTGEVAITADGIFTAAGRVIAPSQYVGGLSLARVSSDASTVAYLSGFATTTALQVADLRTSTTRTIALPAWVKAQYPRLIDVSADGSRALLAVRQSRSAGLRLVLGTIDLRTGALAQLGNDLPWPGSEHSVVSADWAFASADPFIAQLGATPIPGTAVGANPIPPRPATDYVTLYQGCRGTSSWPPVSPQRPTLTLSGAIGISPQVPAKAAVTVTSNTNGAVINSFTLTGAGASRALTTGFGNFTYTTKVTFKDGTSVTGSKSVPAYVPATCANFN